jgi:hypothetical protein
LEPAINWVPSIDFSVEVVSDALRMFPQFDDVASCFKVEETQWLVVFVYLP